MKWPTDPPTSPLVLLLDSQHLGGIETHVREVAMALHSCGVPVRVCFVKRYGQDHPIEASLKTEGIAVDYLDGGLLALGRYLRSHAPWVLHTHGYKAGVLGRLAGTLSQVPTMSTYHAGEIPGGMVRLYDLMDRYTGFLADGQLAVSNEIAGRIPFGDVKLVNNFIDISCAAPSKGQHIAFVGRLSQEKGPDRMLEFAEALPEVNFHLYGDGPESDWLKQNAPDNLVFHGHCAMEKHWQDIGLLVMPSRYEGLPLAALEAMARGIPVAATRVGELGRLIESGVDGFLVEEPDYRKLIECIQLWRQLPPADKQSMAHYAHDKVADTFSVEAVLPQMLKNYQDIA